MGYMTCQGCHAVPAACHITHRNNGGPFAESHYCEPCYHALSEGGLTTVIPPPGGAHPGNELESLGDLIYLVLKSCTAQLSDEDAREIARETADEVGRRGGKDTIAISTVKSRWARQSRQA